MILESLEIENFKSYKGKHTVGPLDRFSCVIGPNGSGKSNILDAISFVLNVPNSCLRVKHLKNLIEYSSNEARVRITIQKSTRRTFERRVTKNVTGNDSTILEDNLNQDFTHSTTCKYLVDGVKTTQKEYNQALEDMNILSRVRNFVIYQGDIIKSDVNLLGMIETVCGSDVYIEEYNDLAEKIAVMNRDLSNKYEKRKDCLDMIKEMKEVKEKEKNFQVLITEKDQIQRKIYGLEIKAKKDEIFRISAALDSMKQNKEDEKYDEQLAVVNKLRGEAARLQKDYFEKETELTFLKGRQSKKSGVDVESKLAELKTLQDNLARIEEERSKAAQPLKFEGNFDGEALTAERFKSLMEEKEAEYTQKTLELERKYSELTLQNFDKINRRDQIQANLRQLNTRKARTQARNKEIERENKMKTERLVSITKEIQQLESRIQDRSSAYEKILADEDRMNKEMNDVTRDILLNKARKNDATRRSMVKSVVDSLKTIFSGVHGRVIDLIQPIQKKYEVSIGVLLSRHDQSVVVDNEKTALDCIRYIKETKSCKLTFLPLNRIKTTYQDEDTENTTNTAIKDQIEFKDMQSKRYISYSPEYENVISFVLKNSLIVDDVDRAKHILYHRMYPGRICTLDGVLFSPGGLITGGKTTVNKFENDIIDQLLEKRKSIVMNLKVNKDRKEAFSEVSTIKMKIDDLKQKKDLIKLEVPEMEEINNEEMETELDKLNEALKGFEAHQGQIREAKKQIEKAIFGGILRSIGLDSLSEYKERIKQDYRRQELEIRAETLKERIGLVGDVVTEKKEMREPERDMKGLEEELNKLYMTLEGVKEKMKGQSQALKTYSEKRSQITSKILRYQLQQTRLEEELKDLEKYAELETGYKDELDMESLKLNTTNESVASLKAKLEELNRKISQNVPTVSSADASIQNRFARFNKEYEEAKEKLSEIKDRFREVKTRRMEMFTQCFTAISREISEIYRSLTIFNQDSESNAYLVNEGDPFQNNIKYYLMPPSKRFVPFHELSGGERSIALLSFIFALNSFRKPPFYIFDEVDSALDKVNVERLLRYIQSTEDQFLVVSLKPQFFSRSQSLFGVYKCPFEGTSKVLSYRLE